MQINKNCLDKEIALIQNEEIRLWTQDIIHTKAPDTYFTSPGSSTGKYHPICTFKEGGLIVHVKRVVWFAERLMTSWNMKELNRDIVLSACILHDIAKVGKGSGCYEDYEKHPIFAERYFRKHINFEPVEEFQKDWQIKINDCVKYHMGLWSPKSIVKPLGKYTPHELCVYTSDYMSANKELTTPVDIEIGGVI